MTTEPPNHSALRIVSLFSGRTYSDEKAALGDLAAMIEREIVARDEQHTMELAAISTACIQNTETTIKDRIGRDNPYWTVAYGDVCRAVDREMALRDEQKHYCQSVKSRDDEILALRAQLKRAGNDHLTTIQLMSEKLARAEGRQLP